MEKFDIDIKKDPSEWYNQIIKLAELADLRSGVKGCLVFQPWSVDSMEKMFEYFEKNLKERGHEKYWYPTLIPQKNFELEADHVEGFTPQVFWVTKGGDTDFESDQKLALRPTSETAFYSMFSKWIRSYKDLPLKTYQRANVFRYETKATRPFLRSREFYWLEAHDAFATEKEAYENILADMQTTKDVLFEIFGVPTIVFKRPEWDKFPGAVSTYGADTITPTGKVLQLPSTHMLGTNFSKVFDVKFIDENETEKYAYLTCYGPAISRIFAGVILTHGDNKGLKFPFEIAPKQVVIVPIMGEKEPKVLEKANEIKQKLIENNISVIIDTSDKRPGEKFYFWELKGVPLRIEVGPRDLKNKKVLIYRRDTESKEEVFEKEIVKKVLELGKSLSKNLKETALKNFKDIIKNASSIKELKTIIDEGGIARIEFFSDGLDAMEYAKTIEVETGGEIRGTRIDVDEKPKGKCIISGKKANVIVYVAKSY